MIDGDAQPVVEAWVFAPVTATEPLPGNRGRGGDQLPRPALVPARPEGLLGAHGEGVGLLALLQRDLQVVVAPIDLVAGDPGHGQPAGQGAEHQGLGQLRLGGEAHAWRDVGLGPPRRVVRPVARQVEGAVIQGLAERANVGQEDAHLAVLQLAGDAAVLDADPDRVRAPPEEAGLVDYQHPGGVAQVAPQVGLQVIAHSIGVPLGTVQQMLDAVGGGVAGMFGQLPAILALDGAEQAGQVGAQMPPCFAAGEMAAEVVNDSLQIGGPASRINGRRLSGREGRSGRGHVMVPRELTRTIVSQDTTTPTVGLRRTWYERSVR